jgi:hypothetical protein
MSDSSSVQLFFVEESQWGVTPTNSPDVLSEFRFTNESLTQNIQTATSEEIRSDRQVSDIIRTQVGAGGDVGIELSYGSHDPLLAGGLYDDFSTPVNETGLTVTITLPSPLNNTATLEVSGGSPDPLRNVVVGQFVQLGGSLASPTNDGFYKVTAKGTGSPHTLTVTPAPPSAEVIASATLKGTFIKNGTTRKSFTVEKLFSDLSPLEYQLYTGMRVGSMDLTITPGAIINGTFSFQGKNLTASSSSAAAGTQALSANDVMNAVDNITDILVDGVPVSDQAACFTNVQFTVENNLRDQPCIGSLALGGIGIGRTNVSGTLEAYFRSRALFEKYLNFDTVSVSFRATLGGNSYLFDFPAVKFTSGQVVAGGNDQDVITSLNFEAKRDATSDFMVAINRFAA